MSSPLAKTRKSLADHLLINVHQRVSHSRRIQILAEELSIKMRQLQSKGLISMMPRVIDIGCGDMTLAESLAELLPEASWRCVDVHPVDPAIRSDERWNKYSQFDGLNLNFTNASFDVAIFSDVLHHVPPNQRLELISSAARVSQYVLVKDHFEYGFWSRQILRAMDFIGNFGYGVSIPRRYFSQDEFFNLCKAAGLELSDCKTGIQLYGHIPIARSVLSSNWQFIATLKSLMHD